MAMNNRDRFGDTYANNTTKKMIALYDYDPQVIIFHRRLIRWIVGIIVHRCKMLIPDFNRTYHFRSYPLMLMPKSNSHFVLVT